MAQFGITGGESRTVCGGHVERIEERLTDRQTGAATVRVESGPAKNADRHARAIRWEVVRKDDVPRAASRRGLKQARGAIVCDGDIGESESIAGDGAGRADIADD